MFSNALPGTTQNKIWTNQMSKDIKYHSTEDQAAFKGLENDDNAVVYLAAFALTDWMKSNRDGCEAIVQVVRQHDCILGYFIIIFHIYSFSLKIEKRLFSMAAKKSFWYKELIDYHIDRIRQNGVLDHLKRKYLEPVSNTPEYICSAEQVFGHS